MPVAIVTDSTACLSPADAEREGIVVVPLKVVIGEETFVEGCGLTGDKIAEALRAKLPVSTSRPTPEEFLEVFEKLANDGADAIVSIHLSSKVSGTLDSATVAAKRASIPVTVVDSTTIGLATGFAAGRAARARDAGGVAASMAVAARTAGESSTSLLYVDTLEYLRRGGRIGAAAAIFGGALSVKPLLTIADGKVATLEKVRTGARALARLEDLAVDAAGDDAVDVYVAHLANHDRAEQLAGKLAERLEANLDGREIWCGELGAVLGAHVGPGMVAVCVAPRP